MDWLIVSKDMILLSGRELGENVHPEVVTFSVAVSSEMAPAFHMVVHAQTSRGEIVSGRETFLTTVIPASTERAPNTGQSPL